MIIVVALVLAILFARSLFWPKAAPKKSAGKVLGEAIANYLDRLDGERDRM